MNLTSLYRNHPDLAELLGGPPVHLVSCPDCGQRFPSAEMYALDSQGTLGCGPCCDRRQDAAWAEWLERVAKEQGEEA